MAGLRYWVGAPWDAVVAGRAGAAPADQGWPGWAERVIGGRVAAGTVVQVVDLVLGVVLFAATGLMLGTHDGNSPYVVGLAVGGALAVRQRYPMGGLRTAVVVLVWTADTFHAPTSPYLPSGVIVYVLCLYTVAVRAERRTTVGAAGISIAFAWILGATLGAESASVATIVVVGVAGYGLNVRQRRVLQRDAVEQAKVHREERALLEERQRIARELHDVVAHHMSVIAIQAEAAPYRVKDPQPELAETLADIRRLSLEGLTELRRILGVLRAGTADTGPQPGLDRLADLIVTAETAGLTVRTRQTGVPRELPTATGLSAYRIAQEALSNVMKHAPGATVSIETDYGRDRLRLTIANDPPPTSPRAQGPTPPVQGDTALNGSGSGHGMIGMRERAAMLGGELLAEPTPEGGFVVTATLPVEPA